MSLKIIEKSKILPVSYQELSSHIRLPEGFSDYQDYPAILARYISLATGIIEKKISSGIINKKYLWTRPFLSSIKTSKLYGDDIVFLPLGQCSEVEKIAIYDRGKTSSVIDESSWILFGGLNSFIQFTSGLPQSGTSLYMEITFTSGFGDSQDDVPEEIKQSVLMLAAHYYENRYAFDSENLIKIPFGIAELISSHMRVRI